jgi:Uma2 family endonuclease
LTPSPPLLTPDDLLARPDGNFFELVGGRLKEFTMGAESDAVGGYLLTLLNLHVRPAGLGVVYPQTGFACFPDDPTRVRKPDVAFVAADRLPGGRSPRGWIKVAPDLAAEVVSPHDLYEEVEGKVNEYLAVGVRLVWVVSPGSRTVLVRRPDGTAAVVGPAGTLSGEDVLPGFKCPLADLFV